MTRNDIRKIEVTETAIDMSAIQTDRDHDDIMGSYIEILTSELQESFPEAEIEIIWADGATLAEWALEDKDGDYVPDFITLNLGGRDFGQIIQSDREAAWEKLAATL